MGLFSFGLVTVFLLALLVIVLIAFFVWGVKHALWVALNSIIGFFALYAMQAFLFPTLLINTWSVLIVAVTGLFGLIAVCLLHVVGVWF